MPTKDAELTNKFFTFDVHKEISSQILLEYSSTEMNEGLSKMLSAYGMVAGPAAGNIQYYESKTAPQDKFMAIAETDGFRLIVHIRDHQSLMSFRKSYDLAGEALKDMLMPHVEPVDNTKIMTIPRSALRY